MAKNLKLTIKNTQIAEAINLGNLKNKIAKKQAPEIKEEKPAKKAAPKAQKPEVAAPANQPASETTAAPRRARSKSAFAEGNNPETKVKPTYEQTETQDFAADDDLKIKSSEELRKGIFAEELEELTEKKVESSLFKDEPEETKAEVKAEEVSLKETSSEPVKEEVQNLTPPNTVEEKTVQQPMTPKVTPPQRPISAGHHRPMSTPTHHRPMSTPSHHRPASAPTHQRHERTEKAEQPKSDYVRLGPTGRHVNDLIPKKPVTPPRPHHTPSNAGGQQRPRPPAQNVPPSDKEQPSKLKFKGKEAEVRPEDDAGKRGPKAKEFRDVKPAKRTPDQQKSFDARDRQGLRADEEANMWRKRKHKAHKAVQEDTTIRPNTLKIRMPISIKDLASEMKLKSSQLISKLFMQGLVVTLNDILDDETTIQLLGHEFGCEITIDSSEQERIRITDKTVLEEIKALPEDQLKTRAPIVAFMGHVDHGKTSLIDAIRSSNRAAGEAGAITQHIGAFKCTTPVGDICILDTPGHEAFSAMRARGADVTDIVVLVVAGDEGMKQQTIEAMNHAKEAKVTIVVAINKSDKPNFNPETVYRQLAEQELLPEAWGGQTITVNCSATTKEGINTLLEMLAIQAEVLELRASTSTRARGRVLESEMHKGLGAVATMIVQNGTLKVGDSLVFDQYWGRVKTMQDEFGKNIAEAGPSTPVAITGLSGLPEAGQEFIVVKSEKEAREIAEARMIDMRQNTMMKKKVSMENLMIQASEPVKKVLNVIIRADVQGSLEALKVGLQKIESKKAEVNIISTGVGEVSESDVQLAASSKAIIIGFHTQVESHAETFIRQLGVKVKMHDIIYHAIDDVKAMLVDLLDKIAIETDKGKFEVKAVFKSSQHGLIAGGVVADGSIVRNNHVRIKRNGEMIAKSPISSLKRVKEDVREVQKGLECGIVLSQFTEPEVGDIYESYDVTYKTQEL